MSIERTFLKAKSVDELVDIIMSQHDHIAELKNLIRHLEMDAGAVEDVYLDTEHF